MTIALASIASLAVGFAIGWTAARVKVAKRQPVVSRDFASPGMPYAGIIEADFETVIRRAEGAAQ